MLSNQAGINCYRVELLDDEAEARDDVCRFLGDGFENCCLSSVIDYQVHRRLVRCRDSSSVLLKLSVMRITVTRYRDRNLSQVDLERAQVSLP